MGMPVRVARQFKQFCKTNRYSYWEGIEELMKRAGTRVIRYKNFVDMDMRIPRSA